MTERNALAELGTSRPVRLAMLAGGAMILAGLFARIMAYPLNHDEQMFVSAAANLHTGHLYRDLGYNHMPNLPWLMGALIDLTGGGWPLLVGRLLTFGFWLAALAALWKIGQRLVPGRLVAAAGALLFLGNVLLLGQPAMLATNNLPPITCALWAFLFLLKGLDEAAPSRLNAFLAGLFVSLAIGFKANYIFLAPPFAAAALLAPAARPLGQRLTAGFIPLALGGIVGGLPALAYLASDPQGFLAHTLRYFTELQTAYWGASTEPKLMSVPERVVLAEQIWFSNANLLALTGAFAIAAVPLATGGLAALRRFNHWQVWLLLALILLGMVFSFAPRPSFAQYFAPPIPFFILAVPVLLGRLDPGDRALAAPLLLALCALALLGSVSRLLPDLPRLATPRKWTGVQIHRTMHKLVGEAGLKPGDRVATLSPVHALEGGLSIYPEFAVGPFVYRVAQYIPDTDRPLYRAVSEAQLPAFLAANPPAAVITGTGGELDRGFSAFAASNGYRPVGEGCARPKEGAVCLYRRMAELSAPNGEK